MGQGSSDAIYWIVGVPVFIGLIAALVIWFLKRSYAKYAELWSQLMPLVVGSSKGSRMTGNYQGLPVRAKINAVSEGDGGGTDYFFEINMTAAPRGKDWRLVYGGEKLLGFGEKRWHVSAKDEALKERLNAVGVVAHMQSWGAQPIIKYKAKRGEFEYSEPVAGMFAIPPPERFQAQLDLLAWLSKINEQVNSG